MNALIIQFLNIVIVETYIIRGEEDKYSTPKTNNFISMKGKVICMKTNTIKRMAVIATAVIMGVTSIVTSNTNVEAKSKKVVKFTNVKGKKITMKVGAKKTVKVNVKVKAVRANKKIVTVKKAGKKGFKITAKKTGTAKVTVKTVNGKKTLTVKVSKKSSSKNGQNVKVNKKSENYKIIEKIKGDSRPMDKPEGYENLSVNLRVMDKKVSKSYFDGDHARYDFRTNTVYIEKGFENNGVIKNEVILLEFLIIQSIIDAIDDWNEDLDITKKCITQFDFVKDYKVTEKVVKKIGKRKIKGKIITFKVITDEFEEKYEIPLTCYYTYFYGK